jgi:hypothetical protein
MQPIEPPLNIRDIVGGLLNTTILQVNVLSGGANSQVYKVICDDGACFSAKFCTDVTRLTKEFSSLRFLVSHGFKDVVHPVLISSDQSCAVYDFVEGRSVRPQDVSLQDIDQVVAFIARLKRLADASENHEIANASEACFSVHEIKKNIDSRFQRLADIQEQGLPYQAFHQFLNRDFDQAYKAICSWVDERAEVLNFSLDAPLPMIHRTLSPSDFGFHNVLRREGGAFVFLDFEHFGWDDPTKLISDFLLHPHSLMQISEQLKCRFVRMMLDNFASDDTLIKRLELVYPLFALKWCGILLNEFSPKDLNRRQFAQHSEIDRDVVLNKQLAKAQKMLEHIVKVYRHFPYRDCIYGK